MTCRPSTRPGCSTGGGCWRPIRNLSATSIVLDLVARFTPGVTTRRRGRRPADHRRDHVHQRDAGDVPDGHLRAHRRLLVSRLCRRPACLPAARAPDATPITDADPRGASDLTLSEDLSQVVTRVIARGGGGQAFVDVPAGATELPVTDDGWYSDGGRGGRSRRRSASPIPASRAAADGGAGRRADDADEPAVAVDGLAAGPGLAAGTLHVRADAHQRRAGKRCRGRWRSARSAARRRRCSRRVRPGYRTSGLPTGNDAGRATTRGGLRLGYRGRRACARPADAATTPSTINAGRSMSGTRRVDPVTGHYYNPGLTSSAAAARSRRPAFTARVEWRGDLVSRDTSSTATRRHAGGWLDVANNMSDANLCGSQVAVSDRADRDLQSSHRHGHCRRLPDRFTATQAVSHGGQWRRSSSCWRRIPADRFIDAAADAALGRECADDRHRGVPPSSGQSTVAPGATICR